MSKIIDVNDQDFEAVLIKNQMSVIEFWAEWCAPCKQFAKVLEQVAPKNPDIFFGRVNIETEPKLAEDFDIRSVPFVMIFRENIAVYAEAGAMPETAFEDLLSQAKALDIEKIKQQIRDEEPE